MAARCNEILTVYKHLMREARKFPTYMYRTYSLRRIRDGFKEYKDETDSQKIEDLIKYAKSNLEIIKRQVIVNELYKGKNLVIEQYSKSKNIDS